MNEIKLKYTLNKRSTDEKNGWYRWDLKNGRKIAASVWLTPKEYFENYLNG